MRRLFRNEMRCLGVEIMDYTNGIKVWMSISLSLCGGHNSSLWTRFSSLPLVRRVSFQKQILLFGLFLYFFSCSFLFVFTKSYCGSGCSLWMSLVMLSLRSILRRGELDQVGNHRFLLLRTPFLSIFRCRKGMR